MRAVDHASERRQHLLKCLEFPQIDARRTTIRAAYTKTCRWLLQHSKYQDWLDSRKQSQNRGFLWMRGKAGAGKSTTVKFVYLETKKSKKPSMAVASFFFNARGDYLERSISGMYRSLLLQLLQEFSGLQSVLDNTSTYSSTAWQTEPARLHDDARGAPSTASSAISACIQQT